jgi:uncharacterized membrane protein YgcG
MVAERFRHEYAGTVMTFYVCLGLSWLVGAVTFHASVLAPIEVVRLFGVHVILAVAGVVVARLLGVMAASSGNWSSDYSSSSWSSGSSSSSWSSSSWSSGSSGGWSGGGGSFGGGGASSSW